MVAMLTGCVFELDLQIFLLLFRNHTSIDLEM